LCDGESIEFTNTSSWTGIPNASDVQNYTMKVISIILVFILTLSSDLFAQENPNVLNGYKFAVVDILKYDNSALDVWGISSQVLFALKQKGFI
jgi:hypothetical protein